MLFVEEETSNCLIASHTKASLKQCITLQWKINGCHALNIYHAAHNAVNVDQFNISWYVKTSIDVDS